MDGWPNNILLDWDEAFEAGTSASGGKGWNLGRLKRYGFPIPPGCVLSADACKEFITENGLRDQMKTMAQTILSGRTGKEERDQGLTRLKDRIQRGTFPAGLEEALTSKLEDLGILRCSLAVRSSGWSEDSAHASFAGVYDSFLNVLGSENLLTAIKACYASFWTDTAVSYRHKMNIRHGDPAIAVVIMKMVPAEAAGVGFSCNPRTGLEGEIVINANFGLGDSVVGGMVEPDEYHLGQGLLLPEIRQKRIGSKEGLTVARGGGGTEFIKGDASTKMAMKGHQVLSDEQIIRLASLITRTFDALGKGEQHQDVEWVLAGDDFYLVQARPVTAAQRYTYPALRRQPDTWSNANFRDGAPMVLSTLGRSGIRRAIAHMLETPLRMARYSYLPGVQYSKLYNGRLYYNISAQQWEYYDAFGLTPRETNELLGGHQPEIEIYDADGSSWLSALARNYRKVLHLRNIIQARRKADRNIAQMRHYCRELLNRDYTEANDHEIIAAIGDLAKTHLRFSETFVLLSSGSGFLNLLTKVLEKDFPERASAIANGLLTGTGGITSAEHGYKLLELAELARHDSVARSFFSSEPFEPLRWQDEVPGSSEFGKAFRAFLEEFGHRGVYEVDVANPRWREDPSYLLTFVRDVIEIADPQKIKATQEQKRKMNWQKLREGLTWGRYRLVRWLVAQAAKGAEMREQGKSEMVRFLEVFRVMYLEIGRRLATKGILDQPRDVFRCAWSELVALLNGEWDGEGLKTLVAERREEKARLETLRPPDVIVDGNSQYISAKASILSGDILVGLGVASGRASGKARLIAHPCEGERLKHGEVLVAPSTDPGWTPLFLKASAVVTETGGFLSHGAIVAREYGIPAVCNVPGVTRLLGDGRKVVVDGDEGRVFLDAE